MVNTYPTYLPYVCNSVLPKYYYLKKFSCNTKNVSGGDREWGYYNAGEIQNPLQYTGRQAMEINTGAAGIAQYKRVQTSGSKFDRRMK